MRIRRILAATAVTALAATGMALVAAPAAQAGSASKAKGVTSVELDAGSIGAIAGLGLTPAAVRPARLDGLTASFPITGRTGAAVPAVIKHVGGLSLTDADGDVLVLKNYWINTKTGVLTARAIYNGTDLGRIPFLDVQVKGLVGSAAKPDIRASLTLDAAAAGALSALFGAPDLTGAPIGHALVDFRR